MLWGEGYSLLSPYSTGNGVRVGYPTQMKCTWPTQKKMRLGPNATYISLTRVGGFALGDAKNVRHLTQEIPTCWYFLRQVTQNSFALDDAKVPNANVFASQWNIGIGL